MSEAKYELIPVEVPRVKSKYRRIRTAIPVPESLPVFQALQDSEPQSMMGQRPVVWDKAEGFQVSDRWGNLWIDWSSGVLITNAGHGRKEIRRALEKALKKPLLTTYVFVHERRAECSPAGPCTRSPAPFPNRRSPERARLRGCPPQEIRRAAEHRR